MQTSGRRPGKLFQANGVSYEPLASLLYLFLEDALVLLPNFIFVLLIPYLLTGPVTALADIIGNGCRMTLA